MICPQNDGKPELAEHRVETVERASIKPSPENDEIYGSLDPKDHELVMLAKDMAEHGLREPLVVSSDSVIVSGHRRYAAAGLIGLPNVQVRRLAICRDDYSDLEWKRELATYNRQRLKSTAIRLKESLLAIDPEQAHQKLVAARDERDQDALPEMILGSKNKRSGISDGKRAMLRGALVAIDRLQEYWPLTVRQIHYQLLNNPPLRHATKPNSTYKNDRKSYQDLCDLLARARLAGELPWQAITDETRPVSCTNFNADAAEFVDKEAYWFLNAYRRNLQQSQTDHIEIVAEKLTVQSILKPIANKFCVPLTIGRGFCSLSPRKAIAQRFEESGKDRLILLIASDLDPDGESIAESFARSIRDDFGIEPRCIKALLTMEQVRSWKIPGNGMEAKKTSSRYKAYQQRYGTDDVFELEAIAPSTMQSALTSAIESVMDVVAFNEELEAEKRDAAKLACLKGEVVEFLAEVGFDDE